LSNLTLAGVDGLECIAIHTLKSHLRHSGQFSGAKVWDFMAQAGKSRTGRFSGARYVTLW